MSTTIYRKIGYLQWARRHLDTAKYDLARSNLRIIDKDELGLNGDTIQITKTVERDPLPIEEILSKKYGVEKQHIALTCGATMGLYAAFEGILQKGDEVLLEAPNYEPIWMLLSRKLVTIKTIERTFENQWQIDLTELQRRIGKNTRAVVITNLHNPSGVATDVDKLSAIAQIARDYRALVVCDEVYLDSALDPTLKSGATLASNVISLNSLSKSYGLGGLRCGWIVCQNEEVMDKIRTVVNDYLVGLIPIPSMSIGALALSRADEILAKSRKVSEENIKTIAAWIGRRSDLSWVKPSGGTVAFIKLPPHMDDERLSLHLLQKYDTLVAPGHFFWKKGFIRISFGCDPDTLKAGLKNIAAAVEELSR